MLGGMAEGIIGFPFRYSPSGQLVTVPDGSDTEVEQTIAMIVMTRLGTRTMNPLFGVPDPAFAGLESSDIQAALATFGPVGITVSRVQEALVGADTAHVTISWQRED